MSGDEYMGLNAEFNFHDLDVLGIGPWPARPAASSTATEQRLCAAFQSPAQQMKACWTPEK